MQYRDNINLTWVNGRKLASFTTSDKSVAFTYDGDGNRIQKVSGNGTVDYTVINGVIYAESRQAYVTNDLHFLFDENGNRIGFVHNGNKTYYYRFNLQGDVTGIYSSSGNLIVEYTYDAWGKLEDMTGNTLIGLLNPIRYRGYYYDIETGFYYVSSRYYDPEIGRWINADGVISGTGESVQGYNQFAYCFNNPINMEDQTGYWPKWVKKAAKKVANFIEKVGDALEESFQIEVGVGVGLEVSLSSSLAKLEIGAYQDGYTGGYANGEDYTSVKISAGATGTIAGVGFDGSYELEHRHETNGKWNRDGHDAFSSPFELADCENSYIEKPQGFSVKAKGFSSKKMVASYSNNDVFIGLSGSAHLGIGGHFQIGINITRFIEVFTDE